MEQNKDEITVVDHTTVPLPESIISAVQEHLREAVESESTYEALIRVLEQTDDEAVFRMLASELDD